MSPRQSSQQIRDKCFQEQKPLLEQWVAQLAMFLSIDEKQIGRIGGGKRKPNDRIDVAMIQSLVSKEKVDDLVAGYGHVVIDECHHLPTVSFERVLSEVKARYLVELTATPQRRDGRHPITEMQLGPVRFRVDAKSQAARRPFDHRLIVRDETRNSGILDGARSASEWVAAPNSQHFAPDGGLMTQTIRLPAGSAPSPFDRIPIFANDLADNHGVGEVAHLIQNV